MTPHQSPAAAFPAGSSAGALAPLHAGAPAALFSFTRSASCGGFDGDPSVPTSADGGAKMEQSDRCPDRADCVDRASGFKDAQAGEAVTIPITDTYTIRPYTTWIPDRISMGCQLMCLLPVSLARLSIQGSR